MKVNIKGLDKAAVLATLYNNSVIVVYGDTVPGPSISVEEAREWIKHRINLDYIRCHNLMLGPDFYDNDVEVDVTYFDWAWGSEGQGQIVIDVLRQTGFTGRIPGP